jgi:hypothetical protein
MYFIPMHGYIYEICFISLIRKYDNNNFYFVGTINNDNSFDQFALFTVMVLKVPKCEIFHLFDFNDFYGVKSL